MFLRLTKLQRSRNIHSKMVREKGEKKRPPLQSITEEEKRREEFRPRFCHRSVGQKSLSMSVRPTAAAAKGPVCFPGEGGGRIEGMQLGRSSNQANVQSPRTKFE